MNNYTPEKENGEIDIEKALQISESFEISKQFWAYLKEQQTFPTKDAFINDIDHISFVWESNMTLLKKKRYEALNGFCYV